MKWWSMMTADILGSLAFGEPFRLIEKKRYVAWPPILASTKTHVWTKKTSLIRDIDLSMIFIGVRMELPLIWNLVHRIPLPGVGKPDALFERFSEYGKVAVENTKAAPRGSAKTLFSKMLPEDGEQPFPDSLIAQESANIIIAGSDTTAMALTYLIYAVLIAPDIKSKLLSELSGCSPIPGWEELEGKPYLNKVISETLRLYAPVPASLPRTVPQGGTSLVGYRIPAETTVVTQAYTFHRDPAIWSEPERFDPDRWENPTPEMKEHFMAFGGSARVCVGQNVARLELLHAVSTFFRECPNAEIADTTTATSMDIVDFFVIKPKNGKFEITMR